MEKKKIDIQRTLSEKESVIRKDLRELFLNCPIPADEFLSNLNLFMKRQDVTRLLFLNELYQKILGVHGVIMEFGVRWGRHLASFTSLRGIYEPYNYNRKIIGFDTFEGFPSVHKKDGAAKIMKTGSYDVTPHYEEYLERVLAYHEGEQPLAHIKKFELIRGDASETIAQYLETHPETIVALAYFDMDVYEPTERCLRAIKSHLTRGSIIGFDELNHPDFPGETAAVREVFGLGNYKIAHSRFGTVQSYIEYGA